jgi:hypothetical protein
MQERTIVERANGSSHGRRWRRTITAIGTGIIGAALVAIALTSTVPTDATASSTCAPRVIEVDLSSAARSPQLSGLGQQIIEQAATSAIVCDDNLSVYGVSGGGALSTILTSDDLGAFTPMGPTPQVRSARFGGAQQSALDRLITQRLKAGYQGGDPSITSIGALYNVAAQQSVPGTQVVMITTGVNNDQLVNLNQPLGTGEGAALAKRVPIPRVNAHQITVVGVAQVDASTPPPSPQWPEEVQSFNQALCQASGVPTCRILDLASASESLS